MGVAEDVELDVVGAPLMMQQQPWVQPWGLSPATQQQQEQPAAAAAATAPLPPAITSALPPPHRSRSRSGSGSGSGSGASGRERLTRDRSVSRALRPMQCLPACLPAPWYVSSDPAVVVVD
jgi:hypothetical protein